MRKEIYLICFFLFALNCAAKNVIKVSCIGNSITYGTRINDREKNSYPAQLQKLLGENYKVENFGKPSACLLKKGFLPYIQQDEFKRAMHFAGDICIIHLGVNDTDPQAWPLYRDEFIPDYLALMDSLKSANPKVKFIIALTTPILPAHKRFNSGTKQWQREIQDAIKIVARVSGAQLVDFHSPLYCFPHLQPDAIHPNEEGAAILAKIVQQAITGDYGGLQLPILFSDNMILQRDKRLHFSGQADANAPVTFKIANQKVETRADRCGRWHLSLNPLSAGGPYTLFIYTDKEHRTFKNVLIGDVWLCSGEENMAFKLKNAARASEETPRMQNNKIRLFNMQSAFPFSEKIFTQKEIDILNHQRYFLPTKWKECNTLSAKDFSAVAYFFGQKLQETLDVPIGLICNAVDHSPITSWIDRDKMEMEQPLIFKDWIHNDFIQKELRDIALLNLKNVTNGVYRHSSEPCYLFESGILPLNKYPINGILWYQGESNTVRRENYHEFFSLLLKSWRNYWKDEKLPFYFVQLSSFENPSWTWFRNEQRLLMEENTNVGMVVSSDKGDKFNRCPKEKAPIAERLARWALTETYHQNMIPSGPIIKNVYRKGKKAVLTFDFDKGMHASDKNEIVGFEMAEEEGFFVPAKVKIENGKIYLSAKGVRYPRFVRYGWKPYTEANLVNIANLPASTFRIEVGKE